MLTSGGQAAVGTVQHEGVRYDSNSLSAEDMRSVLEIPADNAPPADTPSESPAEEPAADAAVEPTQEATSQPPTDKGTQKQKKNPQERIDRLTFEREEAKRETQREREESDRKIEALRAEWRREFESLKKPAPQPEAKSQPTGDTEPQLEDFADQADPYAAWMRASARFDARQELKAAEQQRAEAFQKSQTERQQHERQQQEMGRLKTWSERMQGAFARTPDLQAQVEAMPVLPRPMMDVIVDSEIPDQILAHFIAHPEEQARIQGLAPLHQFRAVSRLEYQLEAAANGTGSAVQAKPKTSAHPPVSPVSGSHAAPPSSGEPGPDASYEEHKAYWNQRDAEQRKARR